MTGHMIASGDHKSENGRNKYRGHVSLIPVQVDKAVCQPSVKIEN